MASDNKGQPIEIPKSTGRLSFSSPRSWWFERGGQRGNGDDGGLTTMSNSAPTGHGPSIAGSTSPPPSSSPIPCSPPIQSEDLKGHRASLPAPTVSDWYPKRWRHNSLKFDDEDLMMSMRIPPM